MPADNTVDITVHVPKYTWETLVELSRSLKHKTPAETLLYLAHPHLDTFLRGKGLGIEAGGQAASQALTAALDKMLPQAKAE
jgi:hypothetical protein